jgi:hypothetical protein
MFPERVLSLFAGWVSNPPRRSRRSMAGDTLPMVRPPRTRSELWFRFLAGLAWLAFVAFALAVATSASYPLVFAGVLGGVVVCSSLGLTWLTLWARRKDSRLGQFGIGSLLFLTVYAALFFGTVRWILVRFAAQANRSPNSGEAFLIVAAICLVVAIVSVPVVLAMTEAVLWAAVWLARRAPIRRLQRTRRSR